MLNWFGLSGKATENICADFSKMLSGDTIVTSASQFPGSVTHCWEVYFGEMGSGKVCYRVL